MEVAGLNLHFDVTDTSYMYGGFYRKINDSKMVISGFSPAGKALVAENNTEAWDMVRIWYSGAFSWKANGYSKPAMPER